MNESEYYAAGMVITFYDAIGDQEGKKRAAQRANYVISEGQVPNPDASDFRKPALTLEEAEALKKKGK